LLRLNANEVIALKDYIRTTTTPTIQEFLISCKELWETHSSTTLIEFRKKWTANFILEMQRNDKEITATNRRCAMRIWREAYKLKKTNQSRCN
jgi:hypothetical protein